jgi:hypothetical protein
MAFHEPENLCRGLLGYEHTFFGLDSEDRCLYSSETPVIIYQTVRCRRPEGRVKNGIKLYMNNARIYLFSQV